MELGRYFLLVFPSPSKCCAAVLFFLHCGNLLTTLLSSVSLNDAEGDVKAASSPEKALGCDSSFWGLLGAKWYFGTSVKKNSGYLDTCVIAAVKILFGSHLW